MDEQEVKAYMRLELKVYPSLYINSLTGEVNVTTLAEDYITEHDACQVEDCDGDCPDCEAIYDLAVEVADEYEGRTLDDSKKHYWDPR